MVNPAFPPADDHPPAPAGDEPTPDTVMGVLRGVMDPELGDNIVDLGMVRRVEIDDDGTARVTIALTTAGCPLRATIKRDIEGRVESLPGIRGVKLIWDELNAAEKARVMERARATARDNAAPTAVPTTARVLAIASGKGGVGKSSVTANLAVEIASRGYRVGVLDADIWGFSQPRMLGVADRLAAGPNERGDASIKPNVRAIGDGHLELVSTGLLVDHEGTALMWRGLMLTKAVEQFLSDVDWGPLDYLLIDMPPGTGDVQMGLARMLPQAEMVVVTTPAEAAQRVAIRVADMARRSHMPVLGVIENMAPAVLADGTTFAPFGEGGGDRLAGELGVPMLGSIPLEPAVSEGSDAGRPVSATGADGPAANAFAAIATRLTDDVAPPPDLASCSARMLANIEAALDG